MTCSQNCDQPVAARGLCTKHYQRARASGDLQLLPRRGEHSRFWAKVTKTSTCWNWTGGTQRGYGRFRSDDGTRILAHRFAYEEAKGPVPAGLQLDHLCRNNRGCVNPAHLEAVTSRINILRGPSTLAAINAAKTHCPQGHEYTPENTWVDKRNRRRRCRKCLTDRQRESRRRARGNPAN